ncbi:response regulator [Nafulsella turpanensis]|uniref:response regulator n=1 Tax=Nafulsella turpanensis TaxID=1265690 RepID=UPI00058C886D|nr:response regulator [Nafulsella turpanensis]
MKKPLSAILLVDDDEISNYITKSLIAEMDLAPELEVVTNGKMALDFLDDHPLLSKGEEGHLLVFLDLNMPIMDGFEFMGEFEKRKWKDKVSVIMLTSSSSPKDLNSAKHYNFLGYLQKPFSQEDIRKLLSGAFI